MAFRIPVSPSGAAWRRVVDTALASPKDIVPEAEAPLVVPRTVYSVAPHSLIVLITRP